MFFVSKMADAESDNDLSDDETLDNIGVFDLVNINREERIDLERQWHNLVGDSDDEEEFEGFEAADIYVDKTFDAWRRTENERNIHLFTERVGTVRNFDTGATALNYFQCFYNDEVFKKIVECTNLNADRKRADVNPKGVWSDVSVAEIKALYGLLILMDIMKFDREELYWSDNPSFRLVRGL